MRSHLRAEGTGGRDRRDRYQWPSSLARDGHPLFASPGGASRFTPFDWPCAAPVWAGNNGSKRSACRICVEEGSILLPRDFGLGGTKDRVGLNVPPGDVESALFRFAGQTSMPFVEYPPKSKSRYQRQTTPLPIDETCRYCTRAIHDAVVAHQLRGIATNFHLTSKFHYPLPPLTVTWYWQIVVMV